MLIKMFMKLSHLSLQRKTPLIKKLKVKCLKLKKWELSLERELLKGQLKKEKQLWSDKKQLWRKNKNKGKENLNRSEILNKLRVKQSNYMEKLKNSKDRNFLSRMLVKKLLKKLESSKQISNSLREQRLQLKKLSQESMSAENGWRSIERRYLNSERSKEKHN